jgi:hypothetical protein
MEMYAQNFRQAGFFDSLRLNFPASIKDSTGLQPVWAAMWNIELRQLSSKSFMVPRI